MTFPCFFENISTLFFISRGRVFSHISIEIRKKIRKSNKGGGDFFLEASNKQGLCTYALTWDLAIN